MALTIPVNLSGAEHSWLMDPTIVPQDVAQSENLPLLDYAVPTQAEVDHYEAKGMESASLEFLWERTQPILDGPLDLKNLGYIKNVVDYTTSEKSDGDLNLPSDPDDPHKDDATGSVSVPSSAFFDIWGKPFWQGDDIWGGGPLLNLIGYRALIEPTGIGTFNAVEKPQTNILEHLAPGSLPLPLPPSVPGTPSSTSGTDDAGGLGGAHSNDAPPAIDVDRPGTLTVSSTQGFITGSTVTAHLTDPDGVSAAMYQWASMGSDGQWHAINNATAATYTLTANDAGEQIDVVATYTDGQGHHDTAADSFSVAAPPTSPPGGSGATLLWSQEFDTPLDMKSASHLNGLWAPVDFWQNINSGGYEDFAGTSWNINPNNPTFAPYNPFSVENGYLQIEAFRTPAELFGPIQQEMKIQGIPGAVPEWSGGMLVTNKDVISFTYGYFEFRERIPDQGKGAFPAMWFYSADESADAQGKATAEIDLYEIFGVPNQWHISIHGASSFEAGSQTADTASWHTYGLLWEPDLLQFYRDGQLLQTVTGPQASYFNDLHLSIRVNFSMDAPWFSPSAQSDSTTQSMQMQIDYIRQYSELPFHTGTG